MPELEPADGPSAAARPSTVAVDDSVPARVLAVYAHPDDPEVSSAGTLARWARAGSEVHLLIGTKGDKGTTDPATDPVELAATRRAETEAAAELLGFASCDSLERPDGELDNTATLRAELVGHIRHVRPDVVVGPDPTAVFFGATYINHRDHRELGFALIDAVSPAAASPLYFPDRGDAHQVARLYLSGTLEPDTWVDIGDTLDVKVAALGCHVSQLGVDADVVGDVVRARAAAVGRSAGLAHAEAFRLIRL